MSEDSGNTVQEHGAPEAPADEEFPRALAELVNAVNHAMIDAVNGDRLTPQGVMFGVAIALRQFSLMGREVEGWTDEQASAHAMEAVEQAFSATVSAYIAGKLAGGRGRSH